MYSVFTQDATNLVQTQVAEAVSALAGRISVLAYGRIIETGSPAEIRANTTVRAAYIGEE